LFGPSRRTGFGRQLNETNTTFRSRREAQNRLRLQFLAGRLHALGPRPLFHFLDDLERGADMWSILEVYGRLPAEFIKANGGDKFLEPFAIRGGRE
jgi:hypothetical protein